MCGIASSSWSLSYFYGLNMFSVSVILPEYLCMCTTIFLFTNYVYTIHVTSLHQLRVYYPCYISSPTTCILSMLHLFTNYVYTIHVTCLHQLRVYYPCYMYIKSTTCILSMLHVFTNYVYTIHVILNMCQLGNTYSNHMPYTLVAST